MKCMQQLKQQLKGPWNDEPDYLEWIDQDTGYLCTIKRNLFLALNGYVSVPQGHPLWGIEYDAQLLESIEVHGGLTYSDKEKEGLWGFGFDCAQDGDLVLGRTHPRRSMLNRSEIYRDINYVKEECRKLAKQLKEKESNENN